MKRIYLILVLIFSCFVCNAQSEDPVCRQAFETAKKVYKEKGKEEGMKSFAIVFDCEDDKISAEARKWLADKEREEQEEARQLAIQDSIAKERAKKIAEQKKKESTSKVTGYTPSYTKKKSSFWDDTFGHLLSPNESIIQFYFSYSNLYAGTFSLYARCGERSYWSLGFDLGIDNETQGKEIEDYDPTIYFLGDLGFNMRFLSFYIGFGPAYFWGPGTWAPYEISTSTTVNGEVTHSYNNKRDERYQLGHSLFLLKPSVSLNIPLGDENYLHLNCGYQIFPSKSQLNCLSLGLGFSF